MIGRRITLDSYQNRILGRAGPTPKKKRNARYRVLSLLCCLAFKGMAYKLPQILVFKGLVFASLDGQRPILGPSWGYEYDVWAY